MSNTIEDMIKKHAANTPDKLAISTLNGDLSYSELMGIINKAVLFLKHIGLKKSDCVILSAVPKKEYFAFYFGVHLAGGICVPLAVNAKQDLLNYIAESTNAKFIFADDKSKYENSDLIIYSEIHNIDNTENLVESGIVKNDGIVDVLYTTGTTGLAKGVALTRKNLEAGVRNIINALDMQEDEVILGSLPLNHSNAIGTVRAAMYRGASVVVHDGLTNIKNLEDRIIKYCCTGFSGSPSALKIVDKATKGHMEQFFGHMRYVEIGTAPMDMELKKKTMQALPKARLLINYGATEAARSVYMDLNAHPDKLNSIGKPVKDIKVKIIDDDNQEIVSSKDNVGRLVLCGETCMKGYWNNPELSKEVLIAGGFAPNDYAYIDEDGFIFLMGRADDVIIVGGEKVSPFEIEDALMSNEKIAECACIRVKDKNGILGDVPVMYIVLKKAVTVEKNEFKNYLLGKLEPYKIPVEFIEVDKLPRNYIGKLDRKKMKAMWDCRSIKE